MGDFIRANGLKSDFRLGLGESVRQGAKFDKTICWGGQGHASELVGIVDERLAWFQECPSHGFK